MSTVMFLKRCIEGGKRKEASNDSENECGMGAAREDGTKKKKEKREVNRKIGMEECKEDSYERETYGIGSVDEEKGE